MKYLYKYEHMFILPICAWQNSRPASYLRSQVLSKLVFRQVPATANQAPVANSFSTGFEAILFRINT